MVTRTISGDFVLFGVFTMKIDCRIVRCAAMLMVVFGVTAPTVAAGDARRGVVRSDVKVLERVDMTRPSLAIPELQFGVDADEAFAMFDGNIRATFRKDQPGVVRLSHEEWPEDYFYRVSGIGNPADGAARFTVTLTNEAGQMLYSWVVNFDLNYDESGEAYSAAVSIDDFNVGTTATMTLDRTARRMSIHQFAKAEFNRMGELQVLDLAGTEQISDEPSAGGSVAALLPPIPPGVGVGGVIGGIVGGVVFIVAGVSSAFGPGYNCTTAWDRFWNGCPS